MLEDEVAVGSRLSALPLQASTCVSRRVAPPTSLTAEAQPLVLASRAFTTPRRFSSLAKGLPELVVGSLNWSTSSKANSECGLRLAVASDAPVVTDFVRDFEAVFAGASLLDDAKPPAPKGAAASSSARQGVPTLTV